MSYTDIDRHRDRIRRTLDRARHLDPGDNKRADLAAYGCVLLSGYVEQTTKSLVQIHCENRGASGSVARFIEKQLNRFQNAESSRIFDLINKLDPGLETQARASLSESQVSAIDSVVHLRHQFAHGGQATTSIERLDAYFVEIEAAMVSLRALLA